MRILLTLIVAACLANVSDSKQKTTRPPAWYDFWKKPAENANAYMLYTYYRALDFSKSAKKHNRKMMKGLRRMCIVFRFGVCREKIKNPLLITSTKMPTTPEPIRGRARANPYKIGANETDK